MSAPDPTVATGRPRNPQLSRAILTATQDLLIEHGLQNTTVEAVARAAGSGKAAVYRRWPSKDELVMAAVRDLHETPEVPDTGSLREDLLACALHYTHADDRATRVLAGVLGGMGRNESLRTAAAEAIGEPAAATFGAVIQRWREAGVVSASVPVDVISLIVPSLAFQTVVGLGSALPVHLATSLVDHVLLPALRA